MHCGLNSIPNYGCVMWGRGSCTFTRCYVRTMWRWHPRQYHMGPGGGGGGVKQCAEGLIIADSKQTDNRLHNTGPTLIFPTFSFFSSSSSLPSVAFLLTFPTFSSFFSILIFPTFYLPFLLLRFYPYTVYLPPFSSFSILIYLNLSSFFFPHLP